MQCKCNALSASLSEKPRRVCRPQTACRGVGLLCLPLPLHLVQPALHIVLEYADGGSLLGRIAQLRDGGGQRRRFASPVVTAWLAQLASAVMYMHSKKILHRDLSSDNIFHRANGDVLVGDLGLSKKVGGETVGNISARLASLQSAKAHSVLGTPQYTGGEK